MISQATFQFTSFFGLRQLPVVLIIIIKLCFLAKIRLWSILIKKFIFDDYTNNGYITAWLVNLCSDYKTYLGIPDAYSTHEFVGAFCHPAYYPTRNGYSNFRGPYSINRRCIDGRFVHEYAFDYIRQFNKNYKDVNTFSISSFIEPHEGSTAVVTTVDSHLKEFLEEFMENNNDTIVFLLADHGLHMGFYVFTEAGQRESRLPMLYVLIPKKLEEKFPKMRQNILLNEQKILSTIDLYTTFSHLRTFPHHNRKNFGYSLFDEIPMNRTCEDASIDKYICYCTNKDEHYKKK